MFKCIGVCSKCGRCQSSEKMSSANARKTKMLKYPESFIPKTDGKGFGVAFDIGTTTVVGILWDLKNGKQIASCAKTNPQNEFGMDVISRIMFCNSANENLSILRKRIIDCLNEMIYELCEKVEVCKTEIHDVAICGNTTMSHIFAGYSPRQLALAPFKPEYVGTLDLTAGETGLDLNPKSKVILLPNIAGHVGGDITAGILATGLLEQKGLTLYIDIGTNGEILLTDGEITYACSTAAGPAFEGASISHGMRAAEGAIESVEITSDGDVVFKTIGDCEPQGICGSGLIDVVAQMLKHGLITKTGKLLTKADAERKGINEKLKERLIKTDAGKCFILASKATGEDIVITQHDIREVQLAKGAILAGIRLMLAEMRKDIKDIDKVLLAGAFGNYIDKESAVKIGIFPDISLNNIISVGNAAGAGVSMVLSGTHERIEVQQLPEKIIHLDLSANENFQNMYLDAMSF